jgi:hypothetical protein
MAWGCCGVQGRHVQGVPGLDVESLPNRPPQAALPNDVFRSFISSAADLTSSVVYNMPFEKGRFALDFLLK